MAVLNQEEILGFLIPDVQISKITLESGGSVSVEDNPHIDHERERVSARQKAREEDADSMTVTIDMIVKEKLNDDLLGTWFDQQDLTKYMKIRLFQSTDANITSVLSSGADLIDLVEPRKKVSSRGFKVRLMASTLGVKSSKDVFEILSRKVKRKEISIKKDSVGDDVRLTKFIETTDNDGNTVTEVGYSIRFDLPTSKPQHLSYFAVSHFDLEQMAEDNDIDLSSIGMQSFNGKITSDVVIDEYDVLSRSYIFYDPAGAIWQGAVHQLSDGTWRSKKEETEDSVDLTRTVVTNSKVQDFRDVKEIERLQIDFSTIENELLSQNLTVRLTNDSMDVKRDPEYFSDMLLTKDKDGDSKFFFSIDFEKMLAENAVFGRLMKPSRPRLCNEMSRKTRIRNMKVLRRRVTPNESVNKLGSPMGVREFDKDEPLELITASGEREFKKFNNINGRRGAIRESEIVTRDLIPGVRNFTGMDKQMSFVNDGIYQYGVEIEVDDSSDDFMKEKVRNLMNARAELQKYLEGASKLSMSKYLAEVRDPHIDHPSEHAGTQGSTAGSYDPITNRFTPDFVNRMRKKYSGRDLSKAPWISAVAVYIDTLDTFTEVLRDRKKRYKIVNSLYSFTSPSTGNPRGIMSVLRLIDTLVTSLVRIVGVVEDNNPKKYSNQTVQPLLLSNRKPTIKKTFKVQKFFPQTFDSRSKRMCNFDFLSDGTDDTKNDDGFRVMSGGDYRKRVTKETTRFFKKKEVDINLEIEGQVFTSGDKLSNTEFSYLTPARADFPQRSIVLMEGGSVQDNRAKKKRQERKVESADSGQVDRSDMLTALKSYIALQSTTDVPVDTILDRTVGSGKGKRRTKKKKKNSVRRNQESVNRSLGRVLSDNFSMITRPIRLNVAEQDDSTFTIEVLESAVKPEVSIQCSIDRAQEDKTQEEEEMFEAEKTGNNNMMISLNNLVSSAGLIKTTNNPRRQVRKRASQNSIPAEFSVLNGSFNLKNLKVLNEEGSQQPKMIQGLRAPISEQEMKELPNQVKALFLRQSSKDVVRREKVKGVSESSNDSRNRADADIEFSFNMLTEVEFLSGFEKKSDGRPAIKEKVWKKLKEEEYNQMIGQEVLCRIKPYENRALGLRKNKGMNMQVYDEYFILKPDRQIDKIPTPLPDDGRLLGQVINQLRESLPGITLTEFDVPPSQRIPVSSERQIGTGDREISLDVPLIENGRVGRGLARRGRGLATDTLSPINMPTKVMIVEEDAAGNRRERKFNVKESDQAEFEPKGVEQKKKIKLRDKEEIDVNTKILVEMIAMETQSRNIVTEAITNNPVEQNPLSKVVTSADIKKAASDAKQRDDIVNKAQRAVKVPSEEIKQCR